NPNDLEKEIKSEGRLTFDRNDNLDYIINSGSLKLPFLHLLIKWYQEFHSNTLNMKSADIMDEKGITHNDAKFKEIITNETIILKGYMNLDIIKSDNRYAYKLMRYLSTNFITCNKQYLINRMKTIYKEKYNGDNVNDLILYLNTS